MLKSQLSNSSQSRWLALGLPPCTPALIIFKKKYFWSPAIVEYPPCAGGCRRLNLCQPTREKTGRLSDGLRQLRHQAERYREFLQLKVRPQESDGLEHARLGLVLDYFDTRLAQGVLSFDFVGSGVILRHIIDDPIIEEGFTILTGSETADLIPHHSLEIVGETGDGQHVRQLGGEPGVGIGLLFVVYLGFLAGLHAEEGGVIGTLAMHQGRKTQVGKLLLAAVGDDGLGGALEGHVAVLCSESVGGQAVYQAAAFHTADGGAPAVTRESVGDAGAESIGRIAPEILGVVFAGDAF